MSDLHADIPENPAQTEKENCKNNLQNVENDCIDSPKDATPILQILEDSEKQKNCIISYENEHAEPKTNGGIKEDTLTFINQEKEIILAKVANSPTEKDKYPVFPVRRRCSNEPTIIEEDEHKAQSTQSQTENIQEQNKTQEEQNKIQEQNKAQDQNKTQEQIVPPRRRGSSESNKSVTFSRTVSTIEDNAKLSKISNGSATQENPQNARRQSDEIAKPVVGCAESGVLKPKHSLTSLNEFPASGCQTQPSVPVRARPLSASERRGSNEKRVLPPMSSMEEESLRERIHANLMKQCSAHVRLEPRYNKDTFKRLFQSKVRNCVL